MPDESTGFVQKTKDFLVTNKFYVVVGVITVGLAGGIYYYNTLPATDNTPTTTTVITCENDCSAADAAITVAEETITGLQGDINVKITTKNNIVIEIGKIEAEITEAEADLAEANKELSEAKDDLSDAKKNLIGVSSGFGVFGAIVLVLGAVYLYRKVKQKRSDPP